jgi:hypothetical protein
MKRKWGHVGWIQIHEVRSEESQTWIYDDLLKFKLVKGTEIDPNQSKDPATEHENGSFGFLTTTITTTTLCIEGSVDSYYSILDVIIYIYILLLIC